MANLELKGKVSTFKDDDGKQRQFYDFYTVVEVNGRKMPVRLKATDKASKELIAGALNLPVLE